MTAGRTLVLLAFFALVSVAGRAEPIRAGAVSETVIAPSADSVSLGAASGWGSTFTQDGTFNVGDSGWLEGTFDFSFEDDVTVGRATSAVELYGEDEVTPYFDTLTIFGSGPMAIGDGTWTLEQFSVTGYNIQPYDLQLTADVTDGSEYGFREDAATTPEPAGVALLGTGALLTALTVRRRQVFAG